ncbi:RNA polymerase sigma-70 factor [Mucilaginibacter gynuensis]|uniref:RNA polymerase sigma-70 factor n=1 Tax=Mucilaginibacter gynuensis TaxID=1302236 RepID=A0ABP8FTT1_9SPHI
MSLSQLSDIELWQAIVNDDHAAFSVLFDKYWYKLYTTAHHYLKNEDACKEIAHDIFLNIWLKRKQLDISNFSAYLRASARYHVYKQIKAIRAVPVDYVDNWEDFSTATSINTGETNIRHLELEDTLDNQLKVLPKRCRDIFILSRKQQLSNDQIADMLGISKRTVENQLTHALHHLRLSLKDLSAILILLFVFYK